MIALEVREASRAVAEREEWRKPFGESEEVREMPGPRTSPPRRNPQAGPEGTGAPTRASGSGLRRRSWSTWTNDLSTRRGEQVEHADSGRLVVAADGFCRFEREAVKHREPAGKRVLVVVEQLIAPGDRRFERLLAGHCGAAAAGEQSEAIVERGGDARRGASCELVLLRARSRAGCRRDGRRYARSPSEASASGDESRPHVLRAIHEQCHGDDGSSDGTRHATSPATPSGSRLVANTRSCGHALQERLDHLGGRIEYLLAVVDDEQRVELVQMFGQSVDQRTAELFAQAEHAGHRLGDVAAVRNGGELHEPDAVGMDVELVRRGVQREAGLPQPPVPVSVTSRCSRMASWTAAISASRPTKLETCAGRFVGIAPSDRNGGNSCGGRDARAARSARRGRDPSAGAVRDRGARRRREVLRPPGRGSCRR